MPRHKLPYVVRVIVGATFPVAERDEVAADLATELAQRHAEHGWVASRWWLTVQLAGSVPALLRRGWWRGLTGFESRANANRPGGAPLESLVVDARFAIRRLRSRPLYAALAVGTLAVGVGGSSAILAVTRTFLLDALPVKDEAQLGIFWNAGGWTEQQFLFLRGQTVPGFNGIAAYRQYDATLEQDGDATRLIRGNAVSAELFDVLGARAELGRTFAAGDDALAAPPIVVLSHALWQELGGDVSILGRRLLIGETTRTVVGVMPRGFWFPDPGSRMWIPAPLDPEARLGNYRIIGRATPDRDLASMSATMSAILGMLRQRFDGAQPTWFNDPASITPFRDDAFGALRPALVATLVAMGFILIIACANVAALMLSQIEGRRAEMAVRAALGANRGRITQQILVESLVVGLLAAAVGAGVAAATIRVLVAALPLGNLAGGVTLNYSLFLTTLGLALVAAASIAMLPLLTLWRGDFRDAISHSRTGGIGGGNQLAGGLVIGEIALALLMAVGVALIVRSVANLYQIDPGVARRGVAVVDIVMPGRLDLDKRRQLVRALSGEIEQLVGVRSVSVVQKIPLRGRGWSMGFAIEGQPDIGPVLTQVRIVGPGYFRTMGIPIATGRDFSAVDLAGREYAIIINEALSAKYFGSASPIGKRVAAGPGGMGRVVAVVGNVAEAELTDDAAPVRYLSYEQVPFMVPSQTLVIRTTSDDATSILPAIRRLIQRNAPAVAIQEATTVDAVISRAVGPARHVMILLALLTSLALLLAAIGVYGVVAQFVMRRDREWAIRIALGFAPSQLVGHIVSRGMRLIGLGIALGIAGMTVLVRLVMPFLYGVSAADPTALLTAVALLAGVGALATIIPALRAGRVDPAAVLREQ